MTTASKETSFVTKVVAGVVSFAAALFMLGLMSVPAQAQQTNAELRAQIQSLLDTISQLQSQVDGQSSGSTSADPYMNCNPAIFDARIGQGASGQGVVALQQFLNMSPDTQVAQSGPGSPGNETSFYGPLTAQAVTAFQEKYSSDVLAPVGLSSGTGYWGSSTASKAQELCTTNMTGGDDDMADSGDSDDSDSSGDLDDLLGGGDDSDDGMDDDEDEMDDEDESDDEDETELSGGEASLEDFDISSGDDSDVAEGDSASVADIEVDVEDGDVRFERVDLTMGLTSSDGDEEPWDVYEELALMVGDEEVASIEAGDEDEWLDDDAIDDSEHSLDSNVDYYQIRMSDLDTVVREDDTAEMSVVVETANSVDDADTDPEWEMAVLEDGIRARDGQGIDLFTGDDSDSTTFNVEEEGQGEELSFSESSDNPDESILPVETDDTSDEFGIFVFDVEADDGDIEIEDVPMTLRTFASSSSNGQDAPDFDDVVNDVMLEVGGEEFDDYDDEVEGTGSIGNVGYSSSSLDFEFDDDEFTVEEDEEVTATLFVEFNQQDGNYGEDTGVQALMLDSDRSEVNAEGADDLDSGDIEGSPEGEIHELRTEGVYIEPNDTSTSQSSNDDGDTTQATFQVEYDLTAFEEDFYVPRGAVQATSSGSGQGNGEGVSYLIEDNSGGVVQGTSSASLSSSADQNGNTWEIDEGDTETFTLQVVLRNNNYSGFHNLQVDEIFYNELQGEADDNLNNDASTDAEPVEDFETDQVNLD